MRLFQIKISMRSWARTSLRIKNLTKNLIKDQDLGQNLIEILIEILNEDFFLIQKALSKTFIYFTIKTYSNLFCEIISHKYLFVT